MPCVSKASEAKKTDTKRQTNQADHTLGWLLLSEVYIVTPSKYNKKESAKE